MQGRQQTQPAARRAAVRRRIPSGRVLLNLALLVAVVVAFVMLVGREAPEGGIEIERREPPAGIDEIRVYLSGAVTEPGVVAVARGARVVDALSLAGGAVAGADLGAVNLARRIDDEDHIHVPLPGEGPALIDLNTATLEALESLPGIGPARGGAIIEARNIEPFTSSDDLVARRVIPASVYAGLRDLVTAVDLSLAVDPAPVVEPTGPP